MKKAPEEFSLSGYDIFKKFVAFLLTRYKFKVPLDDKRPHNVDTAKLLNLFRSLFYRFYLPM